MLAAMAAFQQHRLGSFLLQRMSGFEHLTAGFHPPAAEPLSLGQIGRDQVGQRQQLFSKRIYGFIPQQGAAAFGYHYRVQDNEGGTPALQAGGHCPDQLRG